MAISDFATYKALAANPSQALAFTRNNITPGVRGQFYSLWTAGGDVTGVAPTTAVAPTSATPGAIPLVNTSPGTLRALRASYAQATDGTGQPGGLLIIADRLSHQGGLSGTATGEQTTNLPTAALTRYTSGVGVRGCAEIYTAIGTSGATATVRYTNTADVGSRTTPAFAWGATGASILRQCARLPLQVGDTGLKSVQGFTASGSSGSVGNFGITLYMPLLYLPVHGADTAEWDALEDLHWFGQIIDNACLYGLVSSAYTATGVFEGSINCAEDA